MAISEAQTPTTGASITSLAYGSNVTAGNVIAVCVTTGTAGTVVTVSKSSGTATIGTLTRRVGRQFNSGDGGQEIWLASVTGSGSLTIGFGFSGGATVATVVMREFTATNGFTGDGFDTGSNTAANTTTSTTPTLTGIVTSAANGTIVALLGAGTSGGAPTITVGAGFTSLATTGFPSGTEIKLNIAAGTYSASFGLSSTQTTSFVALSIAEAPAATGSLFRPAEALSGLGVGGPFFKNPLG